jgi:peptide-methionine (S)-S-oxide reductase
MQLKIARAYVAQVDEARLFRKPLVTRLEPLDAFYPAEEYHQDYWLKHPSDPYIVVHDLPKVRNFQRALPGLYRDQPVTRAVANQTAQ